MLLRLLLLAVGASALTLQEMRAANTAPEAQASLTANFLEYYRQTTGAGLAPGIMPLCMCLNKLSLGLARGFDAG